MEDREIVTRYIISFGADRYDADEFTGVREITGFYADEPAWHGSGSESAPLESRFTRVSPVRPEGWIKTYHPDGLFETREAAQAEYDEKSSAWISDYSAKLSALMSARSDAQAA